MTKGTITIIGALLAALSLPASAASAPPTATQRWYYEIGGASPISKPVNPMATSITLGAAGSLNLSYSCGRFDITATVSNLFTNVASSLQNVLQATVTGAIAALPLYILQRARPGLYELFQTYIADFTRKFNLALKSCEDFERQILAGKDPYAGWLAYAKANRWRQEQAAGNDAINAKTNVETAGGDLGLPWIGGTNAAGAGQPPVQVIRGATRAGYNLALNRLPTDTTPPPVTPGAAPRLVELFPTPAAAEEFSVRVLGDEVIRTCDGCTREATSGHGLAVELETERTAVATDLATLLSGTSTPTYADLQTVAAPGVAISARVIEGLRGLPDEQRAILAGRLATEIATSRAVEKALAVRRLLLTARREPNIQGNKEALERIDKAVAELEREVDNVLYETRIRREISTAAAGTILDLETDQRSKGLAVFPAEREDLIQLREGGRFQ